jgi:ADP-ribose pyrophosphatase YjhB (NUDIX family)
VEEMIDPASVDCLDIHGELIKVPRDQLILRPAAYAILTQDGKVLLVRLKSTGKYHLPGGGIEAGERIGEALMREVREETGMEIEIVRLAHFEELFFYYNPSGKAYHGFHFYYVCNALPGKKLEDREVFDDSAEQPAWVEIEGLRGEEFQVSGKKIIEIVYGSLGEMTADGVQAGK